MLGDAKKGKESFLIIFMTRDVGKDVGYAWKRWVWTFAHAKKNNYKFFKKKCVTKKNLRVSC